LMKAILTAVLVVGSVGFLGRAEAQQPVTDAGPAKLTRKAPKEFDFAGGQLAELVRVIKSDFGVNLEDVATIPPQMLYSVRVPKMKLKYTPPWHFQDGKRVFATNSNDGLNFTQVLNLYNQVSAESDQSMGKWLMKEVQDGEPGLVMLVPPTQNSSFQVRAFSVPGWNIKELDQIRELISQETDRLRMKVEVGALAGLTASDILGELNYHEGAGILVATGGRVYVEMAGAIIQAAKEKVRIMDIPIPGKPAPEQSGEPEAQQSK
jgi:hypothetical protein